MSRASKSRSLPRAAAGALLGVSLAGGTVLALGRQEQARAPVAAEWRNDWAVDDGFALEMDTEGYEYPSAIAFVPNPGPDAKDPVYFVTELRGTLKVVTNDRSIYTFADSVFTSPPVKELPDIEGETGMAGICLAPKQGYVFVTFAYRDSAGVLRNNIMRLHSAPGTFSTRATARHAFTEVFSSYEAAVSHQIGPCQVHDDLLYVNVADGRKTAQSQQINSLLGKVLRLTLDGDPAPGNPFRQSDDAALPANYVWAYGFRNPFGLRIVDGRVFVAENGSGIDRFVEVRAGENYLWNGSDWSIGTNAAAVLPVVGPVQVDYNPGERAGLPARYAGSYFIALSAPQSSGVLTVPYSLEQRRVVRAPRQFVKYAGESPQVVVGVGIGPDGVYFVPLMPDRTGRSAVLKVVYDPARAHPLQVERDPEVLIAEHGCAGCHRIKGAGGAAAPPLDQETLADRLRERLESSAYRQTVAAVDRLEREPYPQYREARAEVLQVGGTDRVRVWMKYRLMEPRFDDPRAQMPNLGLSEGEARTITAYLLGQKTDGTGIGLVERARAALAAALPAPAGPREMVLVFGAGLIVGMVGLTAAAWLWRVWSS